MRLSEIQMKQELENNWGSKFCCQELMIEKLDEGEQFELLEEVLRSSIK